MFDGTDYDGNQQVNFLNFSLSQNGSATYSSAGFEVGVNFHLTNIKGVLKLVKILANIADSFIKRYDHGDVTVMKWVDKEGKRERNSKCIRAREINYFAD